MLPPLEELAFKYTAIESITGNEGKIAEEVAKDLEKIGWTVKKLPLSADPSRINLLATRGTGPIRLVLNTHLDTVPPFIPPSQDENNIYGRGSNETKGQLASMIMAVNVLAEKNPIVLDHVALLLVVGEEVDHIGMSEASRYVGDTVEFLIVSEPTELKFATIQKGALKVVLKATGIAGHSGYPSSGESAIHKLIPVLSDVLQFSWPSDVTKGDTTVNIGLIKGGQAQNAWAAEASANIFFRVTTSVQDILKKLENIVAGRCTVETLSYNEPVILSSSPLPSFGETQAAFNTDIAYYNGKYLFGAGSIKNAFSENEFMPKKELHTYVEALVELIPKLLQ